MQRRTFLTGALAGTSLLLMGHSPYRRWSQYRALHTVIATDRMDARSFPLGERLATRLTARRPDLNATAVRGQNARSLLSLLKTRQLDLALLRAEDAYQGLHGAGPFAALKMPLRALAGLAPEYLFVLVPAASPVRGIGELRGRRLGIAEEGGRARAKAERVAAAFGLDPQSDLQWEPVAMDEALAALAGGRVAALCLESSVPGPVVAAGDPTAALQLRLLPQGGAVPALMARHGPIYFRASVGADRSPELGAGGDALGETRLLVCREDFPEERARAVAEALAGWDELAPPGTPLPIPSHSALKATPHAPA